MGSVALVDDGKKELVRDVHRLAQLGVRLADSNKGGVIVQYGSESSLISYVKAKQDIDPIMINLKKSVSEKTIKAFSQGEHGVLQYQGHFYVSNVDELRNKILQKLTALDILFTWEPPRCTVICRKSIGGI
ncbi:hypothetical protein MTR67_023829 [Solanum verrucosum]|uniref:Uncharacterized protein n=1 Tax=Solanum verrucosum TaxID=315347 RepID=A0AAF0TSI0_SOLVR|nr:hypothetical protein MTR67_023829 [Solanum verrucosum]